MLMFSTKVKKLLISGALASVVGVSVTPSLTAVANERAEEKNNSEQQVTFTNKEFLAAMEETGTNVEDHLSEKQLQQALTEDRTSETNTNEENIEEQVTFTNEEFFTAMEESGYNVEDYLSDEQIKQALAEDKEPTNSSISRSTIGIQNVNAGSNAIVASSTGGVDIYLSGTVAELIISAGVSAAVAAFIKVPAVSAYIAKTAGLTKYIVEEALSYVLEQGFPDVSNGVLVVTDKDYLPIYVLRLT